MSTISMSVPSHRLIVCLFRWEYTDIADAQLLLNVMISRSRDQLYKLGGVVIERRSIYVKKMAAEMVCYITSSLEI